MIYASGFKIVRSKRKDGNMKDIPHGGIAPSLNRYAFLNWAKAPPGVVYIRPEQGGEVRLADSGDAKFCQDGAVRCDALVAREKGVTLVLLPADCPSLILHLPEYHVRVRHDDQAVEVKSGARLAHIHLGRGPLEQNIIENTLNLLLPADNRNLACTVNAVLVSGIGPCCYRFDEEAYERVLRQHWSDMEPDKDGKYTVDLANEARQRLRDSGVMSFNQLGECTCCSGEYFSNRRAMAGEKEFEGRHLVACWLL